MKSPCVSRASAITCRAPPALNTSPTWALPLGGRSPLTRPAVGVVHGLPIGYAACRDGQLPPLLQSDAEAWPTA